MGKLRGFADRRALEKLAQVFYDSTMGNTRWLLVVAVMMPVAAGAAPTPYRVVAVPGQTVMGAGMMGAPIVVSISNDSDVLVGSDNQGGTQMVAIEQGLGIDSARKLQRVFDDSMSYLATPTIDGQVVHYRASTGSVWTWIQGVAEERVTLADVKAAGAESTETIDGSGVDEAGGVMVQTALGLYYRPPGSGPLVKVIHSGDPVPDYPGYTLGALSTVPCLAQIAADGTMMAKFGFAGPNGAAEALVAGKPGAMHSAYITGEPTYARPEFTWQSLAACGLSRHTGKVALVARVFDSVTSTEYVLPFTGSATDLVATPGTLDDSPENVSFSAAGANRFVFRTSGTAGTQLWVGDVVGFSVIAKEGDPVAGSGMLTSNIGLPQINEAGDVAFMASTTDGKYGLFKYTKADGLKRIIAEGDMVDLGAPYGMVTVEGIRSEDYYQFFAGAGQSRFLSDRGDVVFIVSFTSAAGAGTAALASGGAPPVTVDLKLEVTVPPTTDICIMWVTISNVGTTTAHQISVLGSGSVHPSGTLDSSKCPPVSGKTNECTISELAPGASITIETTGTGMVSLSALALEADSNPADNEKAYTCGTTQKDEKGCAAAGTDVVDPSIWIVLAGLWGRARLLRRRP